MHPGAPRQRAVLAVLLLSADRVVPMEHIADVVWDGHAPTTARTQIAICVAALRKAFKNAGWNQEVITTSAPGYRLRAADHRIDLLEFETMVARSRDLVRRRDAAAATDTLHRALALFRGPLLADVPGRHVATHRARVEELRLSALEQLLSLRLDLGQHQELIGELTTLVSDSPAREKVRALLMLALYRAGRRAEALDTFRRGRRQSIEEHGLEPGPELQRLHNAILRDDPTLTSASGPAVVRTPAQLPPRITALVGRQWELAALDRFVAAPGSSLAVASISGGPGVGKTELAVQWSRQVADRFPDGQLFADLHGHHPAGPADPRDVLAGFLRALGVPAGQVPEDTTERTALYRSMAHGRRMLVLLDDAESFAQVQPLLPGDERCCVVVTSRRRICEVPTGLSLHLDPLARHDSSLLLADLTRARPTSEAVLDRVAELCEDLPLALRGVGALLASKPHWTARELVAKLADDRTRLDHVSFGPTGVRAALAASYDRLGDRAKEMFRRLSLLSVPDFPAWIASSTLDADPVEAEQLVEELVEAHLLHVAGGRYRLPELVRLFGRERAACEDSGDARRAACRRAFTRWLEEARDARHRCGATGVDDAGWFATERASLAAVIAQSAQMGLREVARELASTTSAAAGACAVSVAS
ncbi:BTAD domain-containing putative transcriptional regulator [Actinosynnema sp. CS-041913]|uniref:AfsR/SARP family transcriptional regulator n=1 Tax=Actinosynnema sp. CS-041913 TaxID=3239917 RepID=UPI003D8B81A3